jgi:iron complex transport system substrate-binding protein
MRIVTLACSNTEIVCALGRGDWLVGVDDHSDHPLDVIGRLPRVGPDLQIDVDRVRALRPDLVIASLTVPGHERVVARLDDAGLPYVALEPTSVRDVYENVRLIAERLDVSERGRQLVDHMQSELEVDRVSATSPSILVEWWPKPVIVPGRASWVNQLLRAAGAVNPWGDEHFKSSPVTDEDVVRRDPKAVVMSWCGVRLEKYRPHVVYRREAWRDVSALRCRNVYAIPEAYLGRPGPRLVDGVRALARIVSDIQSSGRASATST